MSGVTGPVSGWPPPSRAQVERLLEYPEIRAALEGCVRALAEWAPRLVALAERVAVARIPAPRDGDR